MPEQDRVSPDLFFELVSRAPFNLDLTELRPIVEPGYRRSMQVQAGAGTGKTTAIALKCIYAIYVEEIAPEQIVATTFTRKAARELQSRIIEYGEDFLVAVRPHLHEGAMARLEARDLNGIKSGTLDSIIQDVLNKYKERGNPPPVAVEPFVAQGLLLQQLIQRNLHRNADFKSYLGRLSGARNPNLATADLAETAYVIRNHCIYNDVDEDAYLTEADVEPGAAPTFELIGSLEGVFQSLGVADYTALAMRFLDLLERDAIPDFTQGLKVILVDEYQDTNYLQERIYFQLARCAVAHGGSQVVVGDDDQALHRFRGATVGLFQQFPTRAHEFLGVNVDTPPLVTNWRSTNEIIRYAQGFVENDPAYALARLPKPPLRGPRGQEDSGDPVLILHDGRPDEELVAEHVAQSLARMLTAVVQGGWKPRTGFHEDISLHPSNGTPADIAIIAASPRERDRSTPENPDGKVRFMGHLRRALRNLGGPDLFNPRGRAPADVPEVGIILGLLLSAFDNAGRITNQMNIPRDLRSILEGWRGNATAFLNQHAVPPHVDPGMTLGEYVESLRNARVLNGDETHTLIVSEVMYRLATWIPYFQQDLEGLAYFELLQRCATQAETIGRWRSRIAYNRQGHIDDSIKQFVWTILLPLASHDLNLDEDLLTTLPPHRIPVLTIHQSKGLEYPMVVVDIGTHVRDGHAYKPHRFPADGREPSPDQQNVLRAEFGAHAAYVDDSRPDQDDRFDEMVRKYFVAATRGQQVLVLVAHTGGLVRNGIPNVAWWHRRDKSLGPRENYSVIL